ncbi:MAG: S41 family peptidase [Aestuariibaculum sp.]
MKAFVHRTLLLLFLIVTSCFKDNDDDITVSTENVNDFVWKGMNSWYYWQENVTDLDDTKDDNAATYKTYLNQYSNPEDFFNSLRYDYGTTDRFSWFIEDYIVQEQQFQGISKSFGLKLRAVQINTDGDVLVYVASVAENSPASVANIKRGDLINAFNGTILNTTNFNTVSQAINNDNITFSFISENNGTLTFLGDKTLTTAVVSENPVYRKTVFNDIAGKKVGYLVYNAFRSSYNDKLNDAFAYFKAENINELILDLRLNGGGSVQTSAYLASMIYDATDTDDIFAKLTFNTKHESENSTYSFAHNLNVYNTNEEKTGTQAINRLTSLSRLYVLTSTSTASASEMIINGLKAYMPVTIIGETTYGKNVGSITLYDAPASNYQNRNAANPNHLYAMQPIVFTIYNKNDESNYVHGFLPDIEVKEHNYWNSILPFGDENEILLKTALDDIRGNSGKNVLAIKATNTYKNLQLPSNNRFQYEMYIDKTFFENN